MSSSPQLLVLDASVGVKWFKPEIGQEAALELLDAAAVRELTIAVPTHFVHEVLSVIARRRSSAAIIPAWETLQDAGVSVVPLTDEVVREAARQCGLLGCSFNDALAPACAALLGATLVSADARAHGEYPDVQLIAQ
ncbi:MAG: PIN domain-containing protein [Actinobacteria bacterium]|nr:MAG: PIN domain-containing protein [Actinomycetota bacterium]